jgi:hypothetical protein
MFVVHRDALNFMLPVSAGAASWAIAHRWCWHHYSLAQAPAPLQRNWMLCSSSWKRAMGGCCGLLQETWWL